MLGCLNAPFACVIGVPWQDCALIGQVLGEWILTNEFVGYLNLSGFANFSSIAIQIGDIGALAPERRGDLARLGLKSMVAGLLACYIFAVVIGVLI